MVGVKGGRQARKADNLAAIYEPIVYKMLEPRRLTTLRTPKAYNTDSSTFSYPLRNSSDAFPSSC
jgi:hypothetical protein